MLDAESSVAAASTMLPPAVIGGQRISLPHAPMARIGCCTVTGLTACTYHSEPAGPAQTACAWHSHGQRATLQSVWNRQQAQQRCCLAPVAAPADAITLVTDEDTAGLTRHTAEFRRCELSTYLGVVQSPGVRPCQTLHVASNQSSKRSSGLHVGLCSILVCSHQIDVLWAG